MSYKLTMYAHCGMPVPILEGVSLEEAQARAKRYVQKRADDDYEVDELEPGLQWELTEPSDSFMVPDDAGILAIEPEPDNIYGDGEDD